MYRSHISESLLTAKCECRQWINCWQAMLADSCEVCLVSPDVATALSTRWT